MTQGPERQSKGRKTARFGLGHYLVHDTGDLMRSFASPEVLERAMRRGMRWLKKQPDATFRNTPRHITEKMAMLAMAKRAAA